VGAVSSCGLLTGAPDPAPVSERPEPYSSTQTTVDHALFDVEPFRALTRRHAVALAVDHPIVVLGSTQPPETVSGHRACEAGVTVVQRRGGGGAVLLRPGDHLWIEAWIPRDDPLWDADVARATAWVGRWWSSALGSLGVGNLTVYSGRAVAGPHGALVCFSGSGPGEVFQGDRKVVGISQWRSREGSLFHTCAYTHWDPRPLVDLLPLDSRTREAMAGELALSAAGVSDLEPAEFDLPALGEVLLASFPTWSEDTREQLV
jgi:lipoate---protein ligase